MVRWLRCHVNEYDLIHIHGVFNFASFTAVRTARKAGVPCVVRPFGVLNRWGMERRKAWLKNLVFKWLEKPMLDAIQALHFTSDEEAEDVARLKIKAPGFVIPLGLDLCPYNQLPSTIQFDTKFPDFRADKSILFLSRIDAKKGLDLLLPAFKQVQSKHTGVKLIIAGDGEPALIDELKNLAKELAIEDSILWTGFLFGRFRLKAMAKATVFCLPSRSENFGMALLEAMAAGLPCVATDQVALSIGAAKAGAVCMTPVAAEPLAEALNALLSNEQMCRDLSVKAQKFAADFHSMSVIARRLKVFYERLCDSSGNLAVCERKVVTTHLRKEKTTVAKGAYHREGRIVPHRSAAAGHGP